jgi:diguanylate cyclase (GGDEF)-like protein
MPEFPSASSSDATSGIFSLTQIRHLMRVEFSRAQRYGYSLVCLVIAVDRLGYLRDLYGFDSKEAILEDLVRLLESETRGCDFLGRLVDDRLMAVLPHTDEDGARVIAERLLRGARELQFEADGRPLQVTVAIGGSHYAAENTLFFDALVEASERAQVEAANAGGDRYLHLDPTPKEA